MFHSDSSLWFDLNEVFGTNMYLAVKLDKGSDTEASCSCKHVSERPVPEISDQ